MARSTRRREPVNSRGWRACARARVTATRERLPRGEPKARRHSGLRIDETESRSRDAKRHGCRGVHDDRGHEEVMNLAKRLTGMPQDALPPWRRLQFFPRSALRPVPFVLAVA